MVLQLYAGWAQDLVCLYTILCNNSSGNACILSLSLSLDNPQAAFLFLFALLCFETSVMFSSENCHFILLKLRLRPRLLGNSCPNRGRSSHNPISRIANVRKLKTKEAYRVWVRLCVACRWPNGKGKRVSLTKIVCGDAVKTNRIWKIRRSRSFGFPLLEMKAFLLQKKKKKKRKNCSTHHQNLGIIETKNSLRKTIVCAIKKIILTRD